MTRKNLTTPLDTPLSALLADYAAPTEDAGFSDRMMANLRAQDALAKASKTATIDLNSLAARPLPAWRGWLIALLIGALCGLIWARLGVSLPDVSYDSSILTALNSGWIAYGLGGLCVAASLLLIETEAF